MDSVLAPYRKRVRYRRMVCFVATLPFLAIGIMVASGVLPNANASGWVALSVAVLFLAVPFGIAWAHSAELDFEEREIEIGD